MAWPTAKSRAVIRSAAPCHSWNPSAMEMHAPAITVQGRVSSSWNPTLTHSSVLPGMGASRRIQRYFPSRLTEGAAMGQVHRQKQITAAAIGSRGKSSVPTKASSFSRITREAAPAASSMIRPRPAFQKYMGVPKNRWASFRKRAFF